MVRVLDAASPADRAEWLRLWSAWPQREVQAHPAYAALFASARDRVVCAAAEDGGGGVLYPLVVRPLASEPWAAAKEDRWDAVTPYGYGGPFAWGDAAPLADAFWSGIETWALESGVVSSFARLSLFPEQLLPFRGDVSDNMPNVVRRLDVPADALWRDYAHKVRKNVNAARRAGVEVEFDLTGARLDAFLEVYLGTMHRRGAAEGFYFPRSFFETIVRELPGGFAFAHALHGGEVVSTELVLLSAEHVYSFLGGTRSAAFDLRPNDLLKHAVAEWGREQGKRAYVLGGGYGGPDGIFRYKLSFAPGGQVAFRVGRQVHDPAGYAALVATRRAFEARRGAAWQPRAGFFPEYRA